MLCHMKFQDLFFFVFFFKNSNNNNLSSAAVVNGAFGVKLIVPTDPCNEANKEWF